MVILSHLIERWAVSNLGKLRLDQVTSGHKALLFRRKSGSKLLKVLSFDLEMGYSLEGSMSVNNMYARIVLATKKFYHGFIFSFFFHICALTLTTLSSWQEVLTSVLSNILRIENSQDL